MSRERKARRERTVSLASRVMGASKAIGGSLDPQVLVERTVLRAQRGRRGCPVRKAPQVQLERRASWGCQVSPVTLDVRALRDPLDFLGPWAHWERKGSGAKQGSRGWKESEDHPAPVGSGDSRGLRGSQVPRATWARMEPLVFLEKRASLVYKAPRDSLGRRALPAPRGKTGNRGIPDREENWASKVRQARLDQLVS